MKYKPDYSQNKINAQTWRKLWL